jgi:hypothetical protein
MLWKKTTKQKQTQNSTCEEIITFENYVNVIANDPFSPGHVCMVGIDPESITSVKSMGYGNLDNTQVPIVRLTYKNGWTEDVLDVGHHWSE